MARKFVLSSASNNKINKFLISINDKIDSEQFDIDFYELVFSEVKKLKDCAENVVVDYYIEETEKCIKENVIPVNFTDITKNVRNRLVNKYTSNKQFDNNIDIYFNEVKKEYIKHPVSEQDELEMLPENRDIFIKNNLKLVIECAKRYQNMGLPFEDLIQAGNYGLLVAWEKYDKNRAVLRKNIIDLINNSAYDEFSYADAVDIIKEGFVYSKNLEKTLELIPDVGFGSKALFIQWVKTNVKTAVFASVAFQWIRANIVIELNQHGKIIRPKKVKDEHGKMVSEQVTIIDLDSVNPHTQDCYNDNTLADLSNDEFAFEDEQIERQEYNDVFKSIVNNALYKLGNTERRIIKKRYGIGMPYQLSVNEIAESEGLSSNNVKYILTTSLKIIANNIGEKDKEILFELLSYKMHST